MFPRYDPSAENYAFGNSETFPICGMMKPTYTDRSSIKIINLQ
jgi:hypothetical protein